MRIVARAGDFRGRPSVNRTVPRATDLGQTRIVSWSAMTEASARDMGVAKTGLVRQLPLRERWP